MLVVHQKIRRSCDGNPSYSYTQCAAGPHLYLYPTLLNIYIVTSRLLIFPKIYYDFLKNDIELQNTCSTCPLQVIKSHNVFFLMLANTISMKYLSFVNTHRCRNYINHSII